MSQYSTRTLLAAAIASRVRAADSEGSLYATPHKYSRLVLAASPDPGDFDSRSVDAPFVFQNDGVFYMTYIGCGMGERSIIITARWRGNTRTERAESQ